MDKTVSASELGWKARLGLVEAMRSNPALTVTQSDAGIGKIEAEQTPRPSATQRQDSVNEHPADDVLIEAYLQGENAAFDTLYDRHKGAIYRFCLRQLPEDAAHDVFQDTWTKAITQLQAGRYEAKGAFPGFLFAIAHSSLMDYFRRNKRFANASPEHLEHASEPLTQQISEAQLVDKLHEQIQQLPLNQRTVWLIRNETNLSLGEIAKATGTTIEGVRSRLRYASDKLKAGMQRYVRS